MATSPSQFQPDYAVPPGSILEERLEVNGISQAEFARRCGRSPKLISEIISGDAPVEPETALQFEKVLGVDARIWIGLEANYQLHRAREVDANNAKAWAQWANRFPVRELVERRCIEQPESDADTVSKLLMFFGVASVEAWTQKFGQANVAYRHSRSFKSEEAALATWFRLGDLEASRQDCPTFSQAKFMAAMREIRGLTRAPLDDALENTKRLCNEAGVAFAVVKPIPKTAVSGSAWWQTPRKAVIQLSGRHKSDDHLWFSFFHEAAHILLHSKKSIFVDAVGDNTDEMESEANDWASSMLVSRLSWEMFVSTKPRRASDVRAFANEQGIAPGIIVGMLQHGGHLPWTHLNGLKVRYKWRDGA